MGWMTRDEIGRHFDTLERVAKMGAPELQELVDLARRLAVLLIEKTPPCADQSAAIRDVRSSVLWSINAAMRRQTESRT